MKELLDKLESQTLEIAHLKRVIEGYEALQVERDRLLAEPAPSERWEDKDLKSRLLTVSVKMDAHRIASTFRDRGGQREELGNAVQALVWGKESDDFRKGLRVHMAPNGNLFLSATMLRFDLKEWSYASGIDRSLTDLLRGG